jgi:hypothetical protein
VQTTHESSAIDYAQWGARAPNNDLSWCDVIR